MNIEVKMGDLVVTKSPDNLMASGIGSCLVIALYDPKLKIGALAHCMLPTRNGSCSGSDTSNPKRNTQGAIRKTQYDLCNPRYDKGYAKYVDEAIDKLLERMETLGAERAGIEAKLVGGANMFKALKMDLGSKNISSAREKLEKADIAIIGECVGGGQGRSVEFSAASGIVTIKTKF